jgi:hypothetical protein
MPNHLYGTRYPETTYCDFASGGEWAGELPKQGPVMGTNSVVSQAIPAWDATTVLPVEQHADPRRPNVARTTAESVGDCYIGSRRHANAAGMGGGCRGHTIRTPHAARPPRGSPATTPPSPLASGRCR